MTVNPHCHLELDHHEDISLGISRSMILEKFNKGGKTRLECEQHLPMGWTSGMPLPPSPTSPNCPFCPCLCFPTGHNEPFSPQVDLARAMRHITDTRGKATSHCGLDSMLIIVSLLRGLIESSLDILLFKIKLI